MNPGSMATIQDFASRLLITILVGCLAASHALPAFAQPGAALEVNLPAQPMEATLRQLAEKHKMQVGFNPADIRGVNAPEVRGRFTVDELLTKLIAGTTLTYSFNGHDTIVVNNPGRSKQNPTQVAQASVPSAGASEDTSGTDTKRRQLPTSIKNEGSVVAMPEILVTGSRALNMDIRRDRDDPQPYVIFNRESLENSGATNLDEFLKKRLPMNTVGFSNDQTTSVFGAADTVNLRGLGSNQTLILVDGHRSATLYALGTTAQPNVNGIPLAAIERIEVLPTTASGIYGGSATGGVVNIILRRDYSGTEIKLTYDNTFATDSARRRVDLSAGLNLEGGKTNVLIGASYAAADLLLQQDRNFLQRGRNTILSNNSGNYGALSISGFPPLGATPNITSADGSVLVLRNGTSLGSSITYIPSGYAGPNTDNGSALVGNAGRYNLDLANSASFLGPGGRTGLLNAPTSKSLTITARRQFPSKIEGFVEASASDITSRFASSNADPRFTLPASSPANPFVQSIRVTVPQVGPSDAFLQTWNSNIRLLGGVIAELPHHWLMEADYTWGRARQKYETSPILDPALGGTAAVVSGSLNVLRDVATYPVEFSPYLAQTNFSSPFDSTLRDVTLRASGPVTTLPAGALMVSTLLERREELFGAGTFRSNSTLVLVFPGQSQTVQSIYLETRVPVVSAQNKVPGISELDLQLAARRDEYAVHGATGTLVNPTPTTPIRTSTTTITSTDPTVALSYKPVRDLMLRASFGTGFLPPTVSQVLPGAPLSTTTTAIDPRRGNTPIGVVQSISGGNASLEPEKSKSVSVGMVFSPSFFTGLRLSIDYTKIRKTDNIFAPSFQQVVDNESALSGRVVRGPNLPSDPVGWAGPITLINTSNANIARADIDAFDVQVDYRKETSHLGTFDFFSIAGWQTHYKTQLLPSLPVVENAGISSSTSIPVRFKANAGLTWSVNQWTLGWNCRVFGSYLVADPTVAANAVVIRNQGAGGRVPSQLYHDAFVTYRVASKASRFFSNTEIQLGVRNVFNKEPPFDAAFVGGYGYYSPLADPRLASYYFSVRSAF